MSVDFKYPARASSDKDLPSPTAKFVSVAAGAIKVTRTPSSRNSSSNPIARPT